MAKSKIGKETYLQWYQTMVLIRKFEERAGMLYGQQKIRGFCHLYIGQEAVAAGTISAIRKEDPMITAYRDHGLAIAKGISPKACMAELFGKETGVSKGKGGSMHFFSKENYFFGGHGIVGAHIPLGAGIAFAEKYKGTDNVCLCFFGDGAIHQGSFHETMNMAALWDIPVIFICENNHYAMGTAVERSSSILDLYKKGEAYGITSEAVNGMKCEDVHDAMVRATAYCRSGKGPYFLEIKTYRYKGHSMSDPGKYRSKEEVQDFKTKDPIEDVLKTILAKNYATQSEIDAIDSRITAELDDCVKFAEESAYPSLEELYHDIYVQSDYPFITD